MPDTPAHRPSAFARSCGGNVTVMIDSVPGISSAPPTPCSARNTISCWGELARPHANENRVNTASPPRNIRLRPYRSPRMPPVSSSEANASTYASTTHWSSEKPALRSCWMRGSATLTTVLSSIAIARAKHIVSRTMTFSRAFSPSNPSMHTLLAGRIRCSTDAAAALFPVDPAYRGPRTCPGRRDAGRILAGPVLELVDLHRRFRDVVALDGVSFTVPEGRIVGFVGRNGAGKTTAMRIALGVLDADQGQVRWRDAPVDTAARRRFGYMPEERGLYPKMRVLEQLVYLARLRGTSKAEARANAERLLATLEVVGDPDARGESLSLGNQQRVQLAAALVHRPELLVLDEPFSGLDPVGVDVLSGVLRRAARDEGAAAVFSSHQLDLVERLCDEVVLIDEGRIAAHGTIDELRASRARNLWQVQLRDVSTRWWEVIPGTTPVRSVDGTIVLELLPATDPQRVLDVARSAGDVLAFGPVRASLQELFREVVS